MKIRMRRLQSRGTDRATGLSGVITHWMMDMGRYPVYLLQPDGLDADGGPKKKIQMESVRFAEEAKPEDLEEFDVPVEALGTTAKDKFSGFEGVVTDVVAHTFGCLHLVIQPTGVNPKTGNTYESREFNIRQCIGDNIPKTDSVTTDQKPQDPPSPDDGTSLRRDGPPSAVQATGALTE